MEPRLGSRLLLPVLRLRPEYAAARFNLASAQIKAGERDAAIENLRRVIAANPDDPLPKKRLQEAWTRGVSALELRSSCRRAPGT